MTERQLSKIDQWTVAYAHWTIKWRWVALIASVVIALFATVGGQYLEFINNYRVFFSEDNPQLQAFEALQARFTKNDNILFVVAPSDGEVFTPKTLEAIEALTHEAWQVPFSIRVDSVTNFQHTRADGDDLTVEDLVKNALDLSPSEIADAREIALAEPLLRNRLISESAHVTGVNVTLQLPGKSIAEVPEAAAFARNLAAQIEADYPDVTIYLTGIVMLNNAFPESSQNDGKTLMPIMFGIIALTLILVFRSVLATVGTMVVIILSIVTGMGLAGWVGIDLTSPSAVAPVVIMTLAVADAVHILVTMIAEMRSGMSQREALVESLRLNMQPVFLTSLTTIFGFLTLNFSDAPPFRDFGNITAMGVAAAFLYSILFLPAFMAIVSVRVRPRAESGTTAMDRLAEFVLANRTRLMWGMTLLIVGLTALVPRIELNDRFVEYFDESIAFRSHTNFAMENLSGIYTVEYSIGSGENGGISDPDYLERLEAFSNWYREQPGVVHVNTLTDTFKRLNMNMHGDDEDWYRLPEERNLAAQYLLLYEISLPYGLDLNNQISIDKASTRLTVTLENISTREVQALEARAQEWLVENTPPAMHAPGTGSFIMFANISKRNIQSMLIGTSVAIVLISLSLIIALRSFKFGAISLLPNLVPALMAFGVWSILVGEANVAISIVTAMTLGIVVDFTIHFLSKYLRARRERNATPEDSVRYAFHTVGTALWVTSFVLGAGFLVLAQSSFLLNSWMGMLTAITIGFALLTDFLFLPPLLVAIERRRHEKKRASVSQSA